MDTYWSKICEYCCEPFKRNKLKNGRCYSNEVWERMRFCSVSCRNKGLVVSAPPPPMKGEQNPSSKLTVEEVRSIREDSRAIRTIARDYCVSKTTIQRIKTFQLWKDVR